MKMNLEDFRDRMASVYEQSLWISETLRFKMHKNFAQQKLMLSSTLYSMVHHKYFPHFVAGIAAGTLECLVGHPMDTIRVMIMSNKNSKGVYSILRDTLNQPGGFLSLYRGSLSEILSSAVAGSLVFGITNVVQDVLGTSIDDDDGDESCRVNSALLFSAAFSGFVDGITSKPLEMIKLRQQAIEELVDVDNIRGSFVASTKAIFREGGLPCFFRGWLPTVLRESIGNMAFFATYQFTKATLFSLCHNYVSKKTTKANSYKMTGNDEKELLNITKHSSSFENYKHLLVLIAGGAAGVGYSIASHPLETASVLMQVDFPNFITPKVFSNVNLAKFSFPRLHESIICRRLTGINIPHGYKYNNMAHCLMNVVKDGGYGELYRGIVPTIMRALPSYAAAFLGYEATLHYIKLKTVKKIIIEEEQISPVTLVIKR
jgi:hypothetical protein